MYLHASHYKFQIFPMRVAVKNIEFYAVLNIICKSKKLRKANFTLQKTIVQL